jgi:nucleotide-binding universal stress UspA family protein
MLVLVCIDLTPLAEHVAQEAAKIASMSGASLALLHVIRTTKDPTVDQLVPPEDMEYRVEQLDALAARIRQTGAAVEAHVLLTEGPVHQLVVDEAVRTRADLILVGSNGRSRTFEFFIGSCTQGVIREALVPVVVVNGMRSMGGPG